MCSSRACLLKVSDSCLGRGEGGNWSVQGSGVRPCLRHDSVDQPQLSGCHAEILFTEP